MTIQYDPQKVTDWLTPLEKVYARQSQQLDRYHSQLRERDRQEEAATLDLPEMFGKLASFSQTIGQVVEARKTELKGKQYDTWRNLDKTEEDIKAEREHWRLKKLNLTKDDPQFQKNLARMSPDVREYLTNLSATEEVWTKEFNIKNSLNYLTKEKWYSELTFQEQEDLKQKGLAIQNNEYENWIKSKLNPYSLSDGSFNSNALDEIQRLVTTNKTTSKVKTKNAVANNSLLKFGERLKTDLATGDGFDAVDKIQNRIQVLAGQNQIYRGEAGGLIKLDQTEIQQASIQVANEIKDLASIGEISEDQIEKLLNYPGLADHPAGKTLKQAFFNKATENALVQAARDGATFKLNKIRAEAKLGLTQVLNKGYAGGYASQEEFDAAALKYKSLVSSEDWKLAEKFNFVSQSESVYNREAEHLNNSISNGTFLTKSNIDRVKNNENNGIVTEFGEKQKAIIQHQKDNQFPTFEQRIPINDATVAEDSGRLTLKEGEVLGPNTWPGKLSLEMTKHEDIFYQKFLKEFPNDTDIPTRVNTAMDALKKRKGFGIPIGEEGAGEWSKDDKGRYPNFVRAKIGKITIKDDRDTWDRDFTARWMWSKHNDTPQTNRVDIFLSTPNAIVTPEANVDMIVSGNLTPEFIYKIGKIPGKTEGEALIQMTEGLINSKVPAHKDLVEKYDLKNKLKKLTTPSTDGKEETPLARKIKAEQYLTDLVDEIGDPDISAIHKIGFANATPKQQKRYYNRLQMIADMTNDENEMNAYPVTQ